MKTKKAILLSYLLFAHLLLLSGEATCAGGLPRELKLAASSTLAHSALPDTSDADPEKMEITTTIQERCHTSPCFPSKDSVPHKEITKFNGGNKWRFLVDDIDYAGPRTHPPTKPPRR
ncbi:hypothetical protein KP509_21G017300 [Ceratopteris richardii]|uniref:Uncharacterized protein n=1 Tax=Ceratopteris richardii TaxID=49495 RepID=A0A8T2S913_CERRI|nr:hypothetical protein KP509_21G017300 [Ceratopteris richardii]